MSEHSRREIVREPIFEDSLALLIRDEERADEYTAAAEDLLSRAPEMGMPGEDEVWTLPTSPVGGKAVYLFYTFDAEAVFFIAIIALDE